MAATDGATLTTKIRLAVEICLVYVRVRRQVRTRPLPDLLEELRAGVLESQGQSCRERLLARELGSVVYRHLPRLPGDTRCLTQALVLTALLARRGIGSMLVIAVAPATEFVAHAWVEQAGTPLLPTGGSDLGRLVT